MLATQLCPALWDPMDYSLPASSVHGISRQDIGVVAISFSRGSSQPRDQTRSPPCRQILYCLSHQGTSTVTATSPQMCIYFIYITIRGQVQKNKTRKILSCSCIHTLCLSIFISLCLIYIYTHCSEFQYIAHKLKQLKI